MKTFLELVNAVERKSGTVNVLSSLTTDVTSPGTARQIKIVAHVVEAYRELQNARNDWNWRQEEFSHALTIAQARYAASDLGLTSFSRWKPYSRDDLSPFTIYDSSLGRGDETELFFLAYPDWRQLYDFGASEPTRPYQYSIDPKGRLCMGPVPDKAYMLRGEYQIGLHTMAVNADTPILPEGHEEIIVWKALMLLHGDDEGQFALGNAAANYRIDFSNLTNVSLPMVGD